MLKRSDVFHTYNYSRAIGLNRGTTIINHNQRIYLTHQNKFQRPGKPLSSLNCFSTFVKGSRNNIYVENTINLLNAVSKVSFVNLYNDIQNVLCIIGFTLRFLFIFTLHIAKTFSNMSFFRLYMQKVDFVILYRTPCILLRLWIL